MPSLAFLFPLVRVSTRIVVFNAHRHQRLGVEHNIALAGQVGSAGTGMQAVQAAHKTLEDLQAYVQGVSFRTPGVSGGTTWLFGAMLLVEFHGRVSSVLAALRPPVRPAARAGECEGE